MKKKSKLKLIILAALYVLLIAGFIVVALQDYSPVEREIMHYRSDNEPGYFLFASPDEDQVAEATITDSGIAIEVYRNQRWEQGADRDNFKKHFGANYEFTIRNYNNFKITGWRLIMTFVSTTHVDSYWRVNTESSVGEDGETIVIVSANQHPGTDEKDQTMILPESEVTTNNDHISFGMTIHSPQKTLGLISVNIIAVTTRSILDNTLFWVLVISGVVLLFVTLLFIAIDIKSRQYKKQKEHDERIIIQSINTFVNFIDAKDPYTRGHSTRVATYSAELASRLKLPEDAKRNLYYIALMHDVGKVSIPDSILQKPGKLTAEERKIIESHTTIGGQMLREFTAIPGIVSGALYHHERFDGTGYPHGLSGQEIPMFARIICVADSYDAMSSRRCYRSKLSYDEIIRELNSNSGKQFDPEIVKVMIDILNDAYTQGRLSEYNL